MAIKYGSIDSNIPQIQSYPEENNMFKDMRSVDDLSADQSPNHVEMIAEGDEEEPGEEHFRTADV